MFRPAALPSLVEREPHAVAGRQLIFCSREPAGLSGLWLARLRSLQRPAWVAPASVRLA